MKKNLLMLLVAAATGMAAQTNKIKDNPLNAMVLKSQKAKTAQALAKAAFEPTVCPMDSMRQNYSPSFSMTTLDVYTNNNLGQRVQDDNSTTYGSFTNYSRTTYSYNANGLVIADLNKTKVGTSYVDNQRSTYAYNANNDQTLSFTEMFNLPNWTPTSRQETTYDNNHNMLVQTYSGTVSNSLTPQSRYSYTYDAGSHLTQEIDEFWGTNSWVNSSKTTLTLNAAGGPTKVLTYEWHVQTSSWRNFEKYDVVSTGSVINSFTTQAWDTINNIWETTERITYTYDLVGNMLIYYVEAWTGTAFIPDYRYTCTYDSRDLQLTGLSEIHNGTSWDNDSRTTMTWDQRGNQTRYLFELYDNNSWKMNFDFKYYYDCSRVGLTEQSARGQLLLYPQPVHDILHIENGAAVCKVFDVNGRMVLSAGEIETLDLSSLPSGLYLMYVTDHSGQAYNMKVVKE